MSQMKPYCFKCGAELDPEAIYCPECGRLQRSMLVRSAGSPPPTPPLNQRLYTDQPQHPDTTQPYTDEAEPDPGQQEPNDDQGWYPAGGGYQGAEPYRGDRVYAQRPYPEQPYNDQPDPAQEHPEQPYNDQPYPAQEYREQPYPAQEYPEQPYRSPDDAYEGRSDAYADQDHGYAAPEQGYAAPDATYAPREPTIEHDYPDQGYQEFGYSDQSHPQPGYPGSGYPEPSYPAQGYDYNAGQYADPADARTPFGYSGDHDPTYGTMADPYTLDEWRPPTSRRPVWLYLVAIAGVGLLGLFAVGFVIGKVLGGSASPAASTPPTQQSAAVATATPASQPSAQPSSAATPDQGTGTASFQKLGAVIPAGCTTKQGCPVRVTLKNTGGRGGGTVMVTLADDSGKDIATFTGPIPVTDPAATVEVDGYATGANLNTYLIAGGLVHITKVTVSSS